MKITTIKISKVWESRDDQDVHASPKGAHTEVPPVSTIGVQGAARITKLRNRRD